MKLPHHNQVLKIVRRVHMYTGLFMVPWVLLFGVSGFIFNHAGWFSSRGASEKNALPETIWESGALAPVASSQALAGAVLDAIRMERDKSGQQGWRLSDRQEPRFTRPLVIEGKSDGKNVELQLDLNRRSGTLTRREAGERQSERNEAATIALKPAQMPVFNQERLEAIVTDIGRPTGSGEAEAAPVQRLRVRNAPELEFAADADGKRWTIRYNAVSGEITAREVPSENGASSRDVSNTLTRLHKTRGYPDSLNVRWWWALGVDCTAALLCIWALTGLAMWWQMKGQRKWGIVALLVCAVVSWVLASGIIPTLR